jgi:long-chain fatty acid transport protein
MIRHFPPSLCALGFLAAVPPARGVAFRVPDQDARAIARGNAFAATADNPSAIYYNPAGVGFLEGTQFRASAYPIWLKVDHDPAAGGGRVSTRDQLQGVAQVYLTTPLGAGAWSGGVGLYTPYGLGTTWPDDAPFRVLGTKAELMYLTLNPVLAWRPLPGLAVAAGPSLDWGRAVLRQGLGPAPADQFNFTGSDVSLTVTAGVMWRPHPRHSFGLSWRGPGEMTFDGRAEFAAGGTRFEQDATYRLNFPQHLVAGWSYRPTPAWNFEVNVDWTDWHAVDTATLGLPGGDTEVRFDWESGFLYEFGVTRTLGPRLALSAGYWYAEQTIPDARYKPIVPDVALHVFSAGVAWRWGAWDLEAVYQPGVGPTRTVRGSEGGLADGDFTYLSHALSLAVGRKF